jgi:hypothetical protein
MFFGMGFTAPQDIGIFGTINGDGNGGEGGGGGWSWAGSLAQIISAGGAAVERVAGSITGHQAQYTQQQYQPIQQQPQVVYRDNPQGNNLSLDRTLGNATNFLAQNIVPVGIFVIGLMLFRSGRR